MIPPPSNAARYRDEQRFIRDGTMWIWTVEGRPVSVKRNRLYGNSVSRG